MAYKVRIETSNGKSITANCETNELLDVLAEAEMGMIALTPDEEDTLRGWLLIHAERLEAGKSIKNHNGTNAGLGKRANGSAYVLGRNGEWPPDKPTDSQQFASSGS